MRKPCLTGGNERGQAALFMAMTLTVSFGLIGLVVDAGWAAFRQEACQAAAQAAAIGGIMYAKANNTTWPPATCNATSLVVCQATPTACPASPSPGTSATTDVQAACKYAAQNGFYATGKQNVTIAANTGSPPTANGVTSSYYLTARVSEQTPLTFLAAIVGRNNTIVSARATAAVTSSPAGSCVYILDPSGSLALNVSNGVSIQSECGFWINSSNSTALSVIGGSTLKALDGTAVNLVGGYTNANGGTISPAPTHSAAAADPFASRNVPLQRSATGGRSYTCDYGTSGGCAHTSTSTYSCDHNDFGPTSYVTTLTLQPGVYCGGIQITGNVGTVTFAPGVYILDGGGMNLTSGGTTYNASGGVSFFNTGTASTYKGINIMNGASITLTAPTSGAMAGLLFYQDPTLSLSVNSNTTSTFAGGANMSLSGSLYFSKTALSWNNGAATTNTTALVVYDATFAGGAYFKKDGTGITSLGGSTTVGIVE